MPLVVECQHSGPLAALRMTFLTTHFLTSALLTSHFSPVV
jgi:hypothetical protein